MIDYLSHHGVKGMKWGVRKDRSSSGRSTFKARVQTGIGTIRNRATDKSETKKTPEPISDAELRSRIQRIQLEQQYAALTARDNKTKHPLVSRGSQVAQEILFGSVQKVGSSYVQQKLNQALTTVDPTYKPEKGGKKDKGKDSDDEASGSSKSSDSSASLSENVSSKRVPSHLGHQATVVEDTLRAMTESVHGKHEPRHKL